MQTWIDVLHATAANAAGLGVLVAFLALLVSAVSSALNAWVGYETRALRRSQTEADVIAYLEQSSQVFQAADLVIRNVGAGVATEITITPADAWEIGQDQWLANLGFVKHGIPLLAPGQIVRTFIGMATDVTARPVRHFGLTVVFRPGPGLAPVRREFRIDFASLDEISQLGSPPPIATAEALTKIADAAQRAVSGAGYLRTDIRTRRDRDREAEAFRRAQTERAARRAVGAGPALPAEAAPPQPAPPQVPAEVDDAGGGA